MTTRPHMKRLNGEGEDSAEWETHLLLRVPAEFVPLVNNFIENGDQYDEDERDNIARGSSRMMVRFTEDVRAGELRIDNQSLSFVVQDLPTILEIYKTPDNTNFYKVADCPQILDCSTAPAESVEAELKAKVKYGDSRDKMATQYPHGINPPMKNVRRRRFRKTKKMKYMDAPQIEQELKRLLRADLEAVSVRWEVIEVEDDEAGDNGEREASEAVDDDSKTLE